MIRERKTATFYSSPGLSHPVAQLASAPAHCQRLIPPAVPELPWHPSLCTLWSPPGRCRAGQEQRRCLVSKGSGAALEGKVPHSQQRAQQTRLREQVSLPDAFVFSCLPPSLASHVTLRMGNNQRKARPRGEDPSTQKSEPPLLLSGVGEQTKRGREGSHPKYYSRERREVRLWDASHAASSPRRARPGCQAGKCRTERKKTKQNKTKKLKHNRNKPNPRGMQHDNPKLEGPPGRRVEELGLQRDQQLSGHSSLHVTLQN